MVTPALSASSTDLVPRSTRDDGLLATIKRDLIAQDRMAIGEGWAPYRQGLGAWWWRYRRNHHAAGIMILFRIREWARRRPSAFLPGLCDRLLEIVHGAHIGRDVTLGVGVYFPHGSAHIHGETAIGDGVVVGVHSGIGLRGSFFSRDMGTMGPSIGAYTRVGTGAKVLGNVSVGERAVIGAGAVVIRDVPEAATVVGVPARVVRQGPVGDELAPALERLAVLRAMADAAGEMT
jgi:serine acetyltransferase